MDVAGCEVPEDRLYDVENDVWLLPGPTPDRATLGVTQLLASFAGRFERVTFRPTDGALEAGRSVATLESVRFTGPVRLPLGATVVEVNPALAGRPKLLNDEPYGAGWLVRLLLAGPLPAVAGLRTAADARSSLAERIAKLRVTCLPAAPDVELLEIGAECSAVLARLGEEVGRRAPGEVVLLVTDDPTSPIELVRWSDRTGHPILAHRVDGSLHRFLVRRLAAPVPRPRPATVSRSGT